MRILDRTNPIRFTSYSIDKDMQVAELYYTYKEEKVLYWIGAIYKDASWGIDIEDTVVEEYTIEKEGQKIVIKEYEIAETKMKRYSAQFSYNGLEYFLMGAIEKEDFEYLIKKLKFF